MSHPLAGYTKITNHGTEGDPTWLKILRAVALVFGVACMAVFLWASWTLYSQLQQIKSAFEAPSYEEQTGETLDLDLPAVPDGPESFWTEEGPDGGVSYCYVDPTSMETICEPVS